jgi:hypothetical protein
MAELSTLPQEVNIEAYGHDTLTVHIKISAALIAGRVFTAQVRGKATSSKVDATFNVVTTATGADIVLSSVDTRRLSSRGEYLGFWDVQLAPPTGVDPVTTLAYGELKLKPDVTRAAA